MNICSSIEACLDDLGAKRAVNTVRIYRNGMGQFATYLREINISPSEREPSELKVSNFIGFVDWIGKHFTNRQTAGVYIAGFKRYFRWLLAHDLIQPTPNEIARFQDSLGDAKYRKGQQFTRTPGKGYSERMVEAAVAIIEPEPRKSRDVALVLLLATSGIRNNEARSLLVKDFDLSERIAYIRHGKGGKVRKAYFSQSAASAIRGYWAERGYANKNDPAFCRHDKGAGGKRTAITTATVRNVVDEIRKFAGIEAGQFTPHFFRHSVAIEALQKTGNLALVQDLLGHESPVSTRIYAKIADEDLQAAHREIFK